MQFKQVAQTKTNRMKKQILKSAVLAAALTVSLAAHAAPTILVTDGVSTSGLIIGTNGSAVYVNGTFDASWRVVITAGTSKPVFGSAASPNMEVDIQATATGSTPVNDLTVVFSDTDFRSESGDHGGNQQTCVRQRSKPKHGSGHPGDRDWFNASKRSDRRFLRYRFRPHVWPVFRPSDGPSFRGLGW